MSFQQQKRLYEAERPLWGYGRTFSDTEEVTAYLNDVIHSEWFIKQYGWMSIPILVADWNSTKWSGCADKKTFTIYVNRRTENVVLHELAHLICPTDEHDALFVSILQHLIRHTMGFYAWSEFTYELKRVDYYGA